MYYQKYLKYKTKYLNLKAGCSTCVTIKNPENEANEYIIHMDEIIGQGVDGTIYNAEKKEGEIKMVVKIMDKTTIDEDKLVSFIEINKIASEKKFGPEIYDIFVKDEKIYMFMEKMDMDLTEWIKKQLEIESWDAIKLLVKEKLAPIHTQMIKSNITVGDKTSDNYMIKGDTFKKIDFTQSEKKIPLSKCEKGKFKFISVRNPKSGMMEHFHIFDEETLKKL